MGAVKEGEINKVGGRIRKKIYKKITINKGKKLKNLLNYGILIL